MDRVFLTFKEAQVLLQALKSRETEVEISLDLNKSLTKVNPKDFKDLKLKKVKPESIYLVEGTDLKRVLFFDDGESFKLIPTDGAPTLTINGFRMHVLKKFKPASSHPKAEPKVLPFKFVEGRVKFMRVPRGSVVLDTCMGLGYTALNSARRAGKVVTVERSPVVVELCKLSPWSKSLFDNKKIEVREGSVFDEIEEMSTGSFDLIIHDPPTISQAGDLYSLEFYKELLRVGRWGCRLFHYVGSPGMSKGVDLQRGVMERLRTAGWSDVSRCKEISGVIAKKKPL
ncbi:MAG: SAM-dependent methyltransferase [Candidatus Diapherotrites archaeon]|nr:SAM-dependent methyltransferase [Candidatus Diapherotrites archaeon]